MKDLLQSDFCAQRLRLLAEPERLLIVQALRQGPMNVGELAEGTSQKLANVSHHLKVLREGGIVESKRAGRFVLYQLAPDVYHSGKPGAVDFLDIGCCRIELPKAVRKRPRSKNSRR